MGSNITLVVTSCDRHDLLKVTLDSFIAMKCGGLKPDAAIIIEDSAVPMPDWLRENIHFYSSNLGKVQWISNGARRGQIYSIDRAYAEVKTDYVFHCEDDWEFVAGQGFMQDSKAILERWPKILLVSLRGNSGWHQLIHQPPFEGFQIAMPYWKGGWGGLTFNPGLRRLSDYKRLGSYGLHVAYGTMGLGHEIALSKMLLDQGFRIADLGKRIVEHIGGSRSAMAQGAPPMPKVLIAIPVCHGFQYGRWEGKAGDSDSYHLSGVNNRIAALRETWLKDVARFPNVTYKLFYGSGGAREALQDEIFLPVADDYGALPAKTIAICRWARDNGFDMLYKCDDDTGVYVDRILQESMSGIWDYAGYLNGRVCTGGTGYWLSRRAIDIIAEHATSTYHWAEDVTISHFLFQHNIQGVHLPGHRTGRADHWFWKNGYDAAVDMTGISAFHAVRPDDMRKWYAAK